ncbi:helix-turn-helix domain-containing protein [Adlercreutzia sp. ZJ473]|uniref:helix-turn-helix domain-containing protein n=1 Tax=Adlercreutzia sp. ZJ473 TaxID=2722822 RepID=UPI0015516763|nr:helix-turn-helix transcriptional regulator [Adlercreutzia sp. ZJ473]
MNREIAPRLASLRREKGLSQEELAAQLGVSRQAVSKWERGEAAPDTGNLVALADLYEVTLDRLVRGEEGRAPVPAVSALAPASVPVASVPAPAPSRSSRGAWRSFPYPVACALFYLLTGCLFGWWHPGWLVFLTIPLYYWIARIIEDDPNYRAEHNGQE